jgi:hypothetical protein
MLRLVYLQIRYRKTLQTAGLATRERRNVLCVPRVQRVQE